jgi:hypothetical protein
MSVVSTTMREGTTGLSLYREVKNLDHEVFPAKVEDMNTSDAEALAQLCTSPQSLRNTLVWYLRGHEEGGAKLVPVAERAIRHAVDGSLSEHLVYPDGSTPTAAEVINRLALSAFVDSTVVQAVLLGAQVLRLPMCVMCSATAKYNAQMWTTKENCNLCQKHFDEFAVKVSPFEDSAQDTAVAVDEVPERFRDQETEGKTEQPVGRLAWLDSGSMDTILTYRDFADALIIRTYRYFDQTIAPRYLQTLIDLLADVFTGDADRLEPKDDNFLSGQSVGAVDLFGVEGYLEGFPALATAWNKMEESHGKDIVAVRRSIQKLQEVWIQTYLDAQLTEEAKARTISLQTLVNRGLPPRPPDFDPFDDF